MENLNYVSNVFFFFSKNGLTQKRTNQHNQPNHLEKQTSCYEVAMNFHQLFGAPKTQPSFRCGDPLEVLQSPDPWSNELGLPNGEGGGRLVFWKSCHVYIYIYIGIHIKIPIIYYYIYIQYIYLQYRCIYIYAVYIYMDEIQIIT